MLPCLIGNWKMHGSLSQNQRLIEGIVQHQPAQALFRAIAMPTAYLMQGKAVLANSDLALAAQDVSAFTQEGAYTGEVSATMLQDIGAQLVLIGHSERRQLLGETNEVIGLKLQAALQAGLQPILCIGERAEDKRAGNTEAVLAEQLSVLDALPDVALMIAYEPVWAIGTGQAASLQDIAHIHAFLHETLLRKGKSADRIHLLYGGSANPNNAAEIMALNHVDGLLVGKSSLEAASFNAMADAVSKTYAKKIHGNI